MAKVIKVNARIKPRNTEIQGISDKEIVIKLYSFEFDSLVSILRYYESITNLTPVYSNHVGYKDGKLNILVRIFFPKRELKYTEDDENEAYTHLTTLLTANHFDFEFNDSNCKNCSKEMSTDNNLIKSKPNYTSMSILITNRMDSFTLDNIINTIEILHDCIIDITRDESAQIDGNFLRIVQLDVPASALNDMSKLLTKKNISFGKVPEMR